MPWPHRPKTNEISLTSSTPAVLALSVAPEQERFVGSVQDALELAVEYPHAMPWNRAVYAGDEPLGFVMVSWNVVPQPPETIGPWFLWKIVDERYQGHGFGAEVVRKVAELVRAAGATELLTSYVPEDDGPAGFTSDSASCPRARSTTTANLSCASRSLSRSDHIELGAHSATRADSRPALAMPLTAKIGNARLGP